MSCPSPYKISVISAYYGPTTPETCGGSCGSCSNCYQANVASVFSGFNGQSSGSQAISNGAMGVDSCFGYGKVTILTYKCV